MDEKSNYMNDDVEECFENLDTSTSPGEPCKCMFIFIRPCCHSFLAVEGWVVFITGVHPEAQEDDVRDKFSDYGRVTNVQLNLDRRSGFVKGYALVEYQGKEEALKAISAMNGGDILGKKVNVDWAFVGKSNVDISSTTSIRKKLRPREK